MVTAQQNQCKGFHGIHGYKLTPACGGRASAVSHWTRDLGSRAVDGSLLALVLVEDLPFKGHREAQATG
jgi:hypothetical protein